MIVESTSHVSEVVAAATSWTMPAELTPMHQRQRVVAIVGAVVGALVVTRSWALITPPSTCSALPLNCGAPLGYFSWEMIAQGAFAAVETASDSSA